MGGFLSDQGAKRKVATAALLTDQDTSVREAMDKVERGEVSYDDPGVHGLQFLPEAIEHIGHKHLLYNSLKESVIKQPEHDSWKQTLNAFLHLFGKSDYRKRFLARCMPHSSPMTALLISRTTQSFFDWKWEFVENMCHWIILAHPRFHDAFGPHHFTMVTSQRAS